MAVLLCVSVVSYVAFVWFFCGGSSVAVLLCVSVVSYVAFVWFFCGGSSVAVLLCCLWFHM